MTKAGHAYITAPPLTDDEVERWLRDEELQVWKDDGRDVDRIDVGGVRGLLRRLAETRDALGRERGAAPSTPAPRVPVVGPSGGLRVKVYDVLRRAVEEGVAAGWRHAHKHAEKPDGQHIQGNIEQDVMDAICEVFDFDDPNDTDNTNTPTERL